MVNYKKFLSLLSVFFTLVLGIVVLRLFNFFEMPELIETTFPPIHFIAFLGSYGTGIVILLLGLMAGFLCILGTLIKPSFLVVTSNILCIIASLIAPIALLVTLPYAIMYLYFTGWLTLFVGLATIVQYLTYFLVPLMVTFTGVCTLVCSIIPLFRFNKRQIA